jgi:hypothetical protein
VFDYVIGYFFLSFIYIKNILKKTNYNSSVIRNPIHRFEILTQVTRFTDLTSLPVDKKFLGFLLFLIYFFILSFNIELVENRLYDLFLFVFYRVIVVSDKYLFLG